jgi:AraC-like DNA-binding protein
LQFTPTDDESASHWLDLAAPAAHRRIDPRIAAAARRIRDDPAATISSRELAAEAGLSESRFLHLFRDQLGTSLRRYRIWVRLVHAGTAIAAGANMTEAAMKSGFASPSHLADRFKSTFGLSATQLLGTGLTLRTP